MVIKGKPSVKISGSPISFFSYLDKTTNLKVKMKLTIVYLVISLHTVCARTICYNREDLQTLSNCIDSKSSRMSPTKSSEGICIDERLPDRIKVSQKKIF